MSTCREFIHASKFGVKDRVVIDGCDTLVGVVTGVLVKEKYVLYEVSWFHNGTAQSVCFEEYRLALKS